MKPSKYISNGKDDIYETLLPSTYLNEIRHSIYFCRFQKNLLIYTYQVW